MEILSPGFLRIILIIAVVLTVLSALLLLLIIMQRWRTDRRIAREILFQKRAANAVSAYENGSLLLGDTTKILQENPPEALNFLMSASDAGTPGQRALLTPLFQALPFREHELKAIRSHHWEVRRDAAERLGYFGDTSLVPTLEGALQDETLDVRFAAARALVRLGSIRTVESTLRALDVPGEMIQRRVAETLSDLGPPAIEPLVEILKNHEPHHTENTLTVIARVLGMLRAHAAIPSLTRLTGHSDVSLRVNCVRALATIGDRSVVPAVTSLSEDPSWEVRNGVMHALGRLQATDQIPVIRKAIGDPVWWVRFSAARALYDLGQPGIQALQDGMREHTDRYAQEMCRQILQEHRIQNTPLPSP